jgi:AcrR family transcriptional regulator
MPLNRFLNLPDEEKDRVLGISKLQFSTHGYDSMSLNLLLGEIDISKGQFYYWFEDKADLFFTIIQEGLDALNLRLLKHGQPTSKTGYWAHMRQIRLTSEQLWEEKEFVEIRRMVSQQIPPNHPIHERLVKCCQPLQSHFLNCIQLGQEWGLVRTDLSASTLLTLTEGVSGTFYELMLDSYKTDSPPSPKKQTLHDLLGRTLRSLLQPTSGEETD